MGIRIRVRGVERSLTNQKDNHMANSPVRSVLDHPLWSKLAPYVRKESYNRDGSARDPRNRFELKTMPEKLDARALRMEVRCCKCGATIHPIRARKDGKARMEVARHRYLSVSCPLNVNISCSRSKAAKEEYARLAIAIPTV